MLNDKNIRFLNSVGSTPDILVFQYMFIKCTFFCYSVQTLGVNNSASQPISLLYDENNVCSDKNETKSLGHLHDNNDTGKQKTPSHSHSTLVRSGPVIDKGERKMVGQTYAMLETLHCIVVYI